MYVSTPIRDLAVRFLARNKLTAVVREHRRGGKGIVRADYYEFIDPDGRGLTGDRIEIIAGDIGVVLRIVADDYLERGGKMRRRRSAA